MEFLTCGNRRLSENVFDKSEESVYKIPDCAKSEVKTSKNKDKGINSLLNKRKTSKKDEKDEHRNENFLSLLEQEDNRDTLNKNQFSWKIKNIKHSSKKLMNKKIASFTNKSSSKNSQFNVKTRSETDISSHSTLFGGRNSLTDLRGKRKKYDFQRSTSDGSTMTALLVRTLIEANSPLDSITEHHDSPRNSPVIADRRTIEKNQQLLEITQPHRILTSSASLKEDFLSESKNKTITSSELSLCPAESTCPNSSSSGDEGEDEDDEDDEDDDEDDDDYDLSEANIEAETVSMVIKNVLAIEGKNDFQLETERSIPRVPSQASLRRDELNKSINTGSTRITKNTRGYISESHLVQSEMKPEAFENYLLGTSINNLSDNWIQPGSCVADDEPHVEPKKSHKILHDIQENLSEKFHHLQEQLHHHGPTGEIRHHPHHPGLLETAMEAMLIEKLNILEAQTGLTGNEISIDPKVEDKPNESLLHDFKENISGKIHQLQDHIHMPHFHGSGHSLKENISEKIHNLHMPHLPDKQAIKDQIHHLQEHIHLPHLPTHSGKIIHHSQPGLLETAMETMLIDKLNILEVQSGITKEQPVLNNQEIRRASADSVLSKKQLAPVEICIDNSARRKSLNSPKTSEIKGPGLLETAMQTILLDKFNLVEVQACAKSEHVPNENAAKKDNRRVSFEAIKKKLSFSLENPFANRKFSKENTDLSSPANKKTSLTPSFDETNMLVKMINEDELLNAATDNMAAVYPSTISKTNFVNDDVVVLTPEIVIIFSDQDTEIDEINNNNKTDTITKDLQLCCDPSPSPSPSPTPKTSVIPKSIRKSKNTVLNDDNNTSVCNLLTNKMLLHEFSNFSKIRSETTSSPSGGKMGHARAESSGGVGITGGRLSQSPAKMGTPGSAVVYMGGKEFINICRRSSDSDLSTIAPKGMCSNRIFTVHKPKYEWIY